MPRRARYVGWGKVIKEGSYIRSPSPHATPTPTHSLSIPAICATRRGRLFEPKLSVALPAAMAAAAKGRGGGRGGHHNCEIMDSFDQISRLDKYVRREEEERNGTERRRELHGAEADADAGEDGESEAAISLLATRRICFSSFRILHCCSVSPSSLFPPKPGSLLDLSISAIRPNGALPGDAPFGRHSRAPLAGSRRALARTPQWESVRLF